jgi:hypothetical protein
MLFAMRDFVGFLLVPDLPFTMTTFFNLGAAAPEVEITLFPDCENKDLACVCCCSLSTSGVLLRNLVSENAPCLESMVRKKS